MNYKIKYANKQTKHIEITNRFSNTHVLHTNMNLFVKKFMFLLPKGHVHVYTVIVQNKEQNWLENKC